MSPQYGYFPNPEKNWLVVKEEHYESVNATFAGSGIQLTRLGRQYLGSAIVPAAFSEAFVKMKVGVWVYEIEQLSLIAKTHPHAAYAAYTHGLYSLYHLYSIALSINEKMVEWLGIIWFQFSAIY